ncbi:MAG: AAA family ATPase [Actinobacteria bacterium]|nr:AAA family ATPase [Actinomycetota bacterium]
MRRCPQCGRENADDARFCSGCGTALAGEREAPREERKVVSVLFADLVGFTSRAERMDPEDVRAVLEPYHARLRTELEQRGGTVEKFIGDAVMALFGAPTAHEDDPERAVRAALAIRDWIREEGHLQLRIAVTTGEALVALGARPAEGEGMASGDVVNTAARLQAGAPVDGILVDDTTYRATSQKIDYRQAEPVSAKGKQEPIPAWEALEARSRFGVDVAQAPRAPLIGRERELDVLVAALDRVRAERSPQLVTLVGVPGIGKSRLVYELSQVVENEPELTSWRQGRSLPYGEGVSFWALGEIVKAQTGILETDSREDAQQRLSASATAFLQGDDADWVARRLGPLVGVESEHELRGDHRAEAFAAWRRFFEALAEERPLVLVFEDLHWADEGLLDFVDHLVEWATGVPILVVCTARPELLARRPGWGGGKPNAMTLSLSSLNDEQTAHLFSALLERSVLPAETQAALLQRAGGNPLYAEEFARMMADRDLTVGNGEPPLPESIQGIVAARLDALSEEEKTLLQDAAVVGKVFWLGTVSKVGAVEPRAAQERLHSLERKEFVRRQQRSSVAADTEYAFRHVLARDVAYGQIPRAARAEKHCRTAEWIAGLGRPDDHAEMLAYHYLTALELARVSGVATDSMVDWARFALREAGDRAYGLGAYPAALAFYRDAVELWPHDDQGRPMLLFRYGQTVNLVTATKGFDVLTEARDALLAAGDSGTAAEAEILIGETFWMQGQRDRTFERVRAAEALVAEAPTSASKAFVVANLSRYAMLAGERDDAIRLGREALDMAVELGNDELRAHALNNIGTARLTKGDRGGLEDIEQSLAIAVAANSPESVRAYGNLASSLVDLGELERAFTMNEEALRAAERFGLDDVLKWQTAELAWQPYFAGRWDDAMRRVDAHIAGFTAEPFWMETPCRWLRGRMLLARGDDEGALVDAERAVELAREAKDPQILWPALSFAARTVFPVDPQRADGFVTEVFSDWYAKGLISSGSESEWLADLTVVIAPLDRNSEFLDAVGRTTPNPWLAAAAAYASGDLLGAAEQYAAIGALPHEAYARLRGAETLVLAGRRAEADPELQRSLAFWRSVGATAHVREGEALLAQSA